MTNKNVDPAYLACPIRQVISRFGDKWSMLVLYSLHNSETGVLRFSELHKHMTDCSQKMLSSTLKNLEQYNLIHREVYPVVPPPCGILPHRHGQVAHACHQFPYRLGKPTL